MIHNDNKIIVISYACAMRIRNDDCGCTAVVIIQCNARIISDCESLYIEGAGGLGLEGVTRVDVVSQGPTRRMGKKYSEVALPHPTDSFGAIQLNAFIDYCFWNRHTGLLLR